MAIIGIGTDLVDIDRFRRTLERTPSMTERLFTESERRYANDRHDPVERYAVRFAAKEATLKALGLGLGGMRMADIEVVRHDSGNPELVLHRGAVDIAMSHGVVHWHVTLSHTDHLAQAVVIAEG